MSREVKHSSQFKKDYKRIRSDRSLVDDLLNVIDKLSADIPLEPERRDHELIGDWAGCRDCHVRPDYVVIYRKYEDVVSILKLMRFGSHSELFR